MMRRMQLFSIKYVGVRDLSNWVRNGCAQCRFLVIGPRRALFALLALVFVSCLFAQPQIQWEASGKNKINAPSQLLFKNKSCMLKQAHLMHTQIEVHGPVED